MINFLTGPPASLNGSSVCYGDPGPVLYERNENQWNVNEIISALTECDNCAESKTVLMYVPHYREWIYNTVVAHITRSLSLRVGISYWIAFDIFFFF